MPLFLVSVLGIVIIFRSDFNLMHDIPCTIIGTTISKIMGASQMDTVTLRSTGVTTLGSTTINGPETINGGPLTVNGVTILNGNLLQDGTTLSLTESGAATLYADTITYIATGVTPTFTNSNFDFPTTIAIDGLVVGIQGGESLVLSSLGTSSISGLGSVSIYSDLQITFKIGLGLVGEVSLTEGLLTVRVPTIIEGPIEAEDITAEDVTVDGLLTVVGDSLLDFIQCGDITG